MNVLFVDDQSSVLDGIAACIHFEKLGIERAFYASSAAGALERLSVHPIDVVLTDIEMPGEDGIWLIRTIRERYPESLTVMLTSHADFEYAQESIRLGCFDYLVQPAPPEEIERVLQRAMQYLYERNKRNQLYEVGRRMQTGAMELLDGVAMNLFSARTEEIRASLELLELLGYPVAEEKHARLLMLTFEQFRRSDTPTVSEKEIHKHLAQALKEAEFSFPIVSLSTVNHEKQFVLLLFSALEDVPELAVDRLHDFFERLCKAIPKEVIRCFVGGAAPFKALWSEYRHVRDVIDGKLEDTGILRWEYEANHPSAADSVYITGSGARWRSLLASGQHRILMNEFEQCLEQIEKIGEKLANEYCLQAAVITGIEYVKEQKVAPALISDRNEKNSMQMGNLVVENGQVYWCFAPKTGGSYSGTGDLFASVLSAGLVKRMSMMTCVELAVKFLSKAIAETVQEGTDRNDGVCFEKYLEELCKIEK